MGMKNVYPQDLFGTDNSYTHIMAIQVVDVVSSTFEESVQANSIDPNKMRDGQPVNIPKDTNLTSQKRLTKDWIYIPAPSNINFTDTHNWEQGDLGKFRAFKYDTVDYGMLAQDGAARTQDTVESLGSDQKGNAEDIRTQSVSNPHMEVMYKSPNFRTFSFQYKLIPFEEKDCDTILQILKLLRYGAATENSRSAFRLIEGENFGRDTFGPDNWLAYPSEFVLKFLIKNPDGSVTENPYISKIKACVMNEVSINYTAVGELSSYENGFPTEIDLTLSLTEVSFIKKNDVLEGY